MADLEFIILRQILKRATSPLTPDQILNEVREMGYPRVKAREVDKPLKRFRPRGHRPHPTQVGC